MKPTTVVEEWLRYIVIIPARTTSFAKVRRLAIFIVIYYFVEVEGISMNTGSTVHRYGSNGT